MKDKLIGILLTTIPGLINILLMAISGFITGWALGIPNIGICLGVVAGLFMVGSHSSNYDIE